MAGELREVVYRLLPRGEAEPAQLPLAISRAAAHVTVETTVAHLDDAGHVWRILNVHGQPEEVTAARAVFEGYRPSHLLEKEVLGASAQRLILWYKYRVDARRPSHTALAFGILGRDTVVTDRTRDQVLSIRLLTRAGSALKEFLREARRSSPDLQFSLQYSGPVREEDASGLTPSEEATLRAAMQAGYYEVPRRAGVRAVARHEGISASAAGYRLRQAERKLVTAHLGGRRMAGGASSRTGRRGPSNEARQTRADGGAGGGRRAGADQGGPGSGASSIRQSGPSRRGSEMSSR